MIRQLIALSALSLLACNGCSHEGGAAPPAAGSATPASPGADALVHVEDDGKTIELARGALVTFKLASNSGTGYVWTPAGVDAALLAQQGEATSEVATELPGGPKVDVVRFKATGPGTAVVEMQLKRPFGSAPPAKVVKITVHIP